MQILPVRGVVTADDAALAWTFVRAAVRPFLGEALTDRYLAHLTGEGARPAEPLEAALAGFARATAEDPRGVDRAVAEWLAPAFAEDELKPLVAFAGAVRRYPRLLRATRSK